MTLSYADPAGDNLDGIQDIEGNDAPSFTNLMVTNNSLEDVTPPELDSASVAEDGEHILLTFNELVSLPSSIDPNSFVVEVSGQTRSGPDELITSSGITYDSDSMSGVDELTLVLNGVVGSNETIKVSYVAPGDGTDIQDLSGNLLSNVIDKPAANNSTRDIIPPVITSPTAVSVRENISTSHVFYTAKTAETTGITFSKESGLDGPEFTVQSNGDVTFNTQPDFEGQNSYSLNISATDGAGNKAVETIAINITDQIVKKPKLYDVGTGQWRLLTDGQPSNLSEANPANGLALVVTGEAPGGSDKIYLNEGTSDFTIIDGPLNANGKFEKAITSGFLEGINTISYTYTNKYDQIESDKSEVSTVFVDTIKPTIANAHHGKRRGK